MSIRIPEIATRYGGLEDEAFNDGRASSALTLRTLAMATNNLIARPEPWIVCLFDASEEPLNGNTVMQGFAPTHWIPISATLPGAKRPGMEFATLKLWAQITNGETCHLQIVTSKAPFREDATPSNADNVVALLGTGDFEEYTLENIPISPGAMDTATLLIRSDPLGTLFDGSEGAGTPVSGTANVVHHDFFICSAASWTNTGLGGSWEQLGTGVNFKRGSQLLESRTVVGVQTNNQAFFYPPIFDVSRVQALTGCDFELFQLPQWRLASIALYTQERGD